MTINIYMLKLEMTSTVIDNYWLLRILTMIQDINIDKIYEKGYSTKPHNTGLGLWEVENILKKA